jgi:transposase
MKHPDYMTVIVESVDDLLSLERHETVARFRDYIRFIRYLKDGTATTQIGSGGLIGLKARQSQNLWALYKTKGLSYLLTERRVGGVGHLSYTQISYLQSFLRESETALTQIQIANWLSDSFGVEFTQSGISKLFSRLKLKLKTGRPVNIRQKEGDVEDFKKNLTL